MAICEVSIVSPLNFWTVLSARIPPGELNAEVYAEEVCDSEHTKVDLRWYTQKAQWFVASAHAAMNQHLVAAGATVTRRGS